MPFAINPFDGLRSYYEDEGGDGAPVVLMYGLMDPVPAARALPIARRLEKHARVIYVDHRGHGLTDKPHDADAYALELRVADVVSVINALGLDRVHFLGISWGARLGFALGEHVPDRLMSLTLTGNQPYAWDPQWQTVRTLTAAMAAAREGGTRALLLWFEAYIGRELPRRERGWLLENDALALDAAWTSALSEGDVSSDLSKWSTPCLIAAGEADEFHDNAKRAAGEIPDATFLSLEGHDHISALYEVDRVLPHILKLLDA
jgi:pimeloyl-ACP methyl ester carboxylesterase